MAISIDPNSGIELNQINVRRAHFKDEAELETCRRLLDAGESLHIVAAMFGINPGRVSEAFPGRKLDTAARQDSLF